MKDLSKEQRQKLEALIARGVELNSQRWDVEGEIEKIIGTEFGDFVSFWGDRCVGHDTGATIPAPQLIEWASDLIELAQ